MKTYTIQIEETLQRNIQVKANNIDEAQDKVEEQYRNCEIVLDADDHVGTKFYQIQDIQEIQKEHQKRSAKMLKKAKAIIPKETNLCYITSYNDNLEYSTKEIAQSIEEQNDNAIYEAISEAYREQEWDSIDQILNEVKKELYNEFEPNDVDTFMDEYNTTLQEIIQDRRTDNVVPELCEQTRIRARIQFYSNYELGYPLWELRAVTYTDYFKQVIDILNINPKHIKEELEKREINCIGTWPNIKVRDKQECISARELVNMLIECPNYYQLTFVGMLPLAEMFEHNFADNKITINKGSMVLLYNHYNGGGTCAEAFLERDLNIELNKEKGKYNKFKLILDVPEQKGGNGYDTDSVYGFAYQFVKLFHYQDINQKGGQNNESR